MQARRFQGKTLTYVTVEPDGYEAGRQYPMIILLHGYGANMGDLAGLSGVLGDSGYVYAMPNAPIELQTGFGMMGFAWADPPAGGEGSGIYESDERLGVFFEEVMAQYGVEVGNVVLGGFSQGGMMSCRLGLARPETFRGLVCLSGVVLDTDGLKERLPGDRTQPIFMSHGTDDTVIPIESARRSVQLLRVEGYAPQYREYEMGHEIRAEVLDDLKAWLHEVLPPLGSS